MHRTQDARIWGGGRAFCFQSAPATETLNRKIMYLRLVRQTGALVDEVGHLGTPVAGAQATALTAENAEKKMPK